MQHLLEIAPVYVVLFSIGCAILPFMVWVLARRMDNTRIREFIEEQGGAVLSIRWAPFGRGWFGNDDSRIYRLRYSDANGDEHECFCKTRMFGGVYTADDRIIHRAESANALATDSERSHLKWQ